MSFIYAACGDGAPLYRRDGEYLFPGSDRAENSSRPVCLIHGNQVFLTDKGLAMPLCTLNGDSVQAGHGGGSPWFTVSGNRIYDGCGGGSPILTADSDDPMALAAAACMTFASDGLRKRSGCDYRVPKSQVADYIDGRDNAEVLGLGSGNADGGNADGGGYGGNDSRDSGYQSNWSSTVDQSFAARFANASTLDKEIQSRYPWFFQAYDQATDAADLPEIPLDYDYTKQGYRMMMRRHVLVGGNYTEHGLVKSIRELKKDYPILEWADKKDFNDYYCWVPRYYPHDEYMKMELDDILIHARENKAAAEKKKAADDAASAKREAERLKTVGYDYEVRVPNLLPMLSIVFFSVAYMIEDGVWAGFGCLAIFICAFLYFFCLNEFYVSYTSTYDGRNYDRYILFTPTYVYLFIPMLITGLAIFGAMREIPDSGWLTASLWVHAAVFVLATLNHPIMYYNKIRTLYPKRWKTKRREVIIYRWR